MASGGNPDRVVQAVEDYFAREDDRFVAALREEFDGPTLAGFVDRWKSDSRPWARLQILAYLRMPLNAPGHHVVVKRLFKRAEGERDHELIAAFLVAFDRLVRRVRKKQRRYEWVPETRQSLVHETEVLATPRNSILPPLPRTRKCINPRTGEEVEIPAWQLFNTASHRLFSYRTRHYLRRRAWRYFRRLGHQRPNEYVPAVSTALLQYADEDVAQPENLLDNWGLLHACFARSAAIEFSDRAANLRPGRTLAELTAAPCFELLWSASEALPELLNLLCKAQSRAVRVWARQLLERNHSAALSSLSVETLFELLEHDNAEVAQFGASLLERLAGIDEWPIANWLRLLEVHDPAALATVCAQFQRRVAPERLDLEQILELATSEATAVARLGSNFLAGRKFETAEERRELVKLGAARCSALGGELAKWALNVAGAAERYDREVVSTLFDSLLETMRQAACTWFEYAAAAQDDPVLWSRLTETPFEDVRLRIVEQLEHRAVRPRIGPRDLAPVWTSVLLGVHRGGRQKLAAVRQLAAAIVERPDEAPQLVPVLAVAVRSIRRPEQRAGLAAVAYLLDRQPTLAEAIARQLPELSFASPTAEGG
ncbi:MAG TPA: hypothetical protein VMV10_14870 [Pirellulales bacterium]|nr:hypothetical protein [Pirellulales bacterium]